MMLSHLEMVARIGAGAAMGGVIGYERDRHKRPVGLRTHLIVAMTAATFMVVSAQFAYFQGYESGGLVDVDGSRIAASVVSGIGFLAGGAILRSGPSVQGLTTAAALWLVTALGLCAGSGMLIEGAAVTVFGILALTLLRRFEDKEDNVSKRRVSVMLEEVEGTAKVREAIAQLGVSISDGSYERRLDEKRRVEMTFVLGIPEAVGTLRVIDAIEKVDSVKRVRVESA